MADETWVVICPHEYLSKRADLDDLESNVYGMIRSKRKVALSELWRAFPCHLWELDAVLRRLKDNGLIIEEGL